MAQETTFIFIRPFLNFGDESAHLFEPLEQSRKRGSIMLRVGDSSDIKDVNTFFSSEIGIFSAVGPEGEDMIVMCPPGEPWFVRKSSHRSEEDQPDQPWHVTKLASWAVSRKQC